MYRISIQGKNIQGAIGSLTSVEREIMLDSIRQVCSLMGLDPDRQRLVITIDDN